MKINTRHLKLICNLAEGMSQKAAAKASGYHPGSVCRLLRFPWFKDEVRRLTMGRISPINVNKRK